MRIKHFFFHFHALIFILFFLSFFFLFQGAESPLAAPLVMRTEDERMVRWDLSADNISTFNDAEVMEARGNVHLKRGNEYLKADFARYYMGTKWVYLKGNVQVQTGKDEIQAEEAEFDLRSRTGWLKKGRFFMSGPHTYLAGEHIAKHWGDVYTFKQAKITTCDGDTPAWSLTADEAVVEIDGYARLTHSSFKVKDTSVAYTPFFIVPVKTSRQTGLLTPEYGVSTGKGLYYNQPFFWAINESSDLTINEYFMEKHGVMHGLEYRANPTSDTKGWLRADWLDDKKRNADDVGRYGGDGLVRNNADRYWLRGMLDTRLPDPDWRFKADLDYVSDQYFLSEFKNSFSGYKRSRDELFSQFRRDLREKDLNRESGFLLSRDWDRFSLALSSFYTQNPTLGHGNRPHSTDDTVQRLPQLDAFVHKGRLLPGLPLEFDATAQAAYMYRRQGTRGARYEMVPRLTMPVNTRYGSLVASAALYQTIYDTELSSRIEQGNGSAPHQNSSTRTLPEFNVAAFTDFARVYNLDATPLQAIKENVGQSRSTALRHSIQPRLEFRHRANENQDRNPRYSSDDRLMPRTELVYSLTNVFTLKQERVAMTKNDEGEMTPTLQTGYREILSLRLEQAYDQREATRTQDRNEYPRRPFGDLFADLTASVWDNVYLSTRNNWSPYMGELTRHQSGVTLVAPGYGRFYSGYDLRQPVDEYTRTRNQNISYLSLEVETAQFGPWSLFASTKHDFKNLSNKETTIDLAYNHQCFTLIGRVAVDPQEENYQLMITLTGLGD